MFFIPVVALVLGVVIRHEVVTAVSLIGAGICLPGAAIIRDPNVIKFQGFQAFHGSRGFDRTELRVLRRWNPWNPDGT